MKITWHPQPDTVAIVTSINTTKIRLTKERWLHITEYHKELQQFQMEILLTISQPDKLFSSPKGTEPNLAAVKVFNRLADYGLATNLTVHYKEIPQSSGFILTAFVISNNKLDKRFRAWQRLK